MQRAYRPCHKQVLILLIACCTAVTAHQEPGCHLRAGTLRPSSSHRRGLLSPVSQGITEISQPWWDFNMAHQYVLIAKQKITQELRQEYEGKLSGSGVMSHYLPVNSFLVVATPEAAAKLLTVEATASVEVFRPEYKIDEQIKLHPAWRAADPDCAAGKECPTPNLRTAPPVNHQDEQGRLVIHASLPRDVMPNMEVVLQETHMAVQAACGGSNNTSCYLAASDYRDLEIVVEPERLRAAVLALAGLPFVHWVELQSVLQLRNTYSIAVCQSGTNSMPPTWDPTNPAFPFWAENITGEGQVVGMSDSGFNWRQCYFDDPDVPEPGPTHRKVVSYRVVGDEKDASGHGTHVAGSLVGSKLSPGDAPRENGMAYNAKIAFTDLGKDGANGLEVINVPPGGIPNLYQYNYDNFGVRLHSDSWGGVNFNYDTDCQRVDEFTWTHPNFSAVVAAGNDGANQGALSTIGSPASAKNCIAVGAALGGEYGARVPTQGSVYELYILSESILERTDVLAGQAELGMLPWETTMSPWLPILEEDGVTVWQGKPNSDTDAIVYDLVFGDPIDGCVGTGGTLELNTTYEVTEQNEVSIKGNVVLLEDNPDGNDCTFFDRVSAAAKAGAVAVLVYPKVAQAFGFPDLTHISTSSAKLPIPAGGVAISTAKLVERILAAGERPQVIVGNMVNVDNVPMYDDIASFSAFGPTFDGRVKPDVIAVGGNVDSANSIGQCDLISRSGTSMAAPFIGGATAIVRDYFMSGYYPSGERNEADSMEPTGALIKAIIVNSAKDMQGRTESGLPLENAPSFRQGWGRTQLNTGLPLPTTTSNFSLWAHDRAVIKTGQTDSYCVTVPKGAPAYSVVIISNQFGNYSGEVYNATVYPWRQPIRTTLVWFDAPASPTAELTIINDLDLDIVVPPGTLNASRGAATYPDRVNTVERATIAFPLSGSKYLLTVSGYNVPMHMDSEEGIMYSLAMTGPAGTQVCSCEEPECDCSNCPSLEDNNVFPGTPEEIFAEARSAGVGDAP